MKVVFLLIMLCLLPGNADASKRARVVVPVTAPLTLACVTDAARDAALPLFALIGILAAGGGTTGEALGNANGTWDMGGFQINSIHIGELSAMGMTAEQVLSDGCVNARAAAWILQKEYRRTGDIWQAIGGYHSRTPRRREAYIRRVGEHLARLDRKGIRSLRSLDWSREAGP